MFKKIIFLMLAMSRAGKTTKVSTLSAVPEQISSVCIKSDATTPVTTDWELSTSAEVVSLTKVELNPRAVYQDTYSRTIAKYNENLNGNSILTDFFGLEKIQEDSGITDPKEYVDARIKEFIENSDFDTIKKIMSNKTIGNYVKRITIVVPASEEFKCELKELGLDSMVLRDTRGIMDINPKDLEKMPNLSMYDLGLDGIDAVLLLCSTEEFPVQAGEWYKTIYDACFKAVPVFLESRTDALANSYKTYVDMVSNITPKEYLEMIREGKFKSFNEMMATYFESGFHLLKTYGAAKNYDGHWYFKYNVFKVEDCLYLNSVVPSLKAASRDGRITEETFNNDYYQFFKDVTVCNMSNMVKRVKEHVDLIEYINKSGTFNREFLVHLEEYFYDKHVYMYPDYKSIGRSDVCWDIMTTDDFLGPRNGITTQNHGKPKYLAAATSAATSYCNISNAICSFKLDDVIRYADGNEIAPDISSYLQEAFVNMYLNKKLKNAMDIYASSFRGYIIIDRNIVVDAIKSSKMDGLFNNDEDALTVVVEEIAKIIFR